MSEQGMFNASFMWLIWGTDQFPNLEETNLNIDSDVILTTPDNSSDRIVLQDVYKINTTWPVVSTFAGTWDRAQGLDFMLKDFKYLRRSDLHGLVFKAAAVVKDTPTDDIEKRLMNHEDRHIDSIAKYNFALIHLLANKFNFTLQVQVLDSEGHADATGRFDGMLGSLQSRRVHLGVNSLIMRPERLDAAHFTGATWQFRVSAIFRHPPTMGKSDSLLVPFTREVWQCLLLSWVILALAFQLMNWLETRRENIPHTNTDYSWSASLLAVSGAITEQGSEFESSWMSWKIVYLVTLIQALLVNSYYGACLVSNLLQPPPKYITTVTDLLSSKLRVGYVDNRHNQDLFQEMSDPLVMQLYQKKIKSPSASAFPVDEAVKKLHKEGFAIHDEAIALYPIIEETFNNDDKCAIMEIVLFAPKMTYSAIQKGSPYKKLFTYGFRLMMENGIMARERATWRADPPKCQILDKFYSVKLEAVALAFIIFLPGLVSAVGILVLERLLHLRNCFKKKSA